MWSHPPRTATQHPPSPTYAQVNRPATYNAMTLASMHLRRFPALRLHPGAIEAADQSWDRLGVWRNTISPPPAMTIKNAPASTRAVSPAARHGPGSAGVLASVGTPCRPDALIADPQSSPFGAYTVWIEMKPNPAAASMTRPAPSNLNLRTRPLAARPRIANMTDPRNDAIAIP
jgi:hypothetical protein